MPYDKRRNLIPFQRRHPARFPRVEWWLKTCGLSPRELEEQSRRIDPRGTGLTRRTLYRLRIGMPNLRSAYLMVLLSRHHPGVGVEGGPMVLDLWDWDVEGYRDGDRQGKDQVPDAAEAGEDPGS